MITSSFTVWEVLLSFLLSPSALMTGSKVSSPMRDVNCSCSSPAPARRSARSATQGASSIAKYSSKSAYSLASDSETGSLLPA